MAIATDKVLHFLAGILIAAVTSVFVNPAWGVVSAIVIGFLKELVWDLWYRKTYFDVVDLAFTGLGGFNYWLIRMFEFYIK